MQEAERGARPSHETPRNTGRAAAPLVILEEPLGREDTTATRSRNDAVREIAALIRAAGEVPALTEQARRAVAALKVLRRSAGTAPRRRGRPSRIPIPYYEAVYIHWRRKTLRREINAAVTEYRDDGAELAAAFRDIIIKRLGFSPERAQHEALRFVRLLRTGSHPKDVLNRITQLAFPHHSLNALAATDRVK